MADSVLGLNRDGPMVWASPSVEESIQDEPKTPVGQLALPEP